MKIIEKYLCLFIGVLLLHSCNDYLDQMPDDRTVIDSQEKVEELLVSAYPYGSYITFCEAMSDNAGDRLKLAPVQTQSNEEAYFWKEITSTFQDTPDFYWNTCYMAIAAANHALEVIEKAADKDKYKASKGEALLARAYNHFMLVSLFSQRYNPATAEKDLGIPYVTESEKVVYGNYERISVDSVYKMIEKDVKEGLPLINNDIYSAPKYHFTESAAYGFASRFYLAKGDFQKAYECANRVLGLNPSSHIRDWGAYAEMDFYDLKSIYTNSSESANILLSGAMSSLGRFSGLYRYAMTTEIRDGLFKSTNVSSGQFLYKIFGSETTLNIPKFQEHFRLSSINASTGRPYIMAPLITMEEILFNRMEALVMMGRFEDAVADINAFLSKRIKDYDANLNGVTVSSFESFYFYYSPDIHPWFNVTKKQKIFLKGILDLKRIEFVQEGMRWLDIKRYNIEVKRKNTEGDVIDILRKDDPRRAIQIPKSAIVEGLEPN